MCCLALVDHWSSLTECEIPVLFCISSVIPEIVIINAYSLLIDVLHR